MKLPSHIKANQTLQTDSLRTRQVILSDSFSNIVAFTHKYEDQCRLHHHLSQWDDQIKSASGFREVSFLILDSNNFANENTARAVRESEKNASC